MIIHEKPPYTHITSSLEKYARDEMGKYHEIYDFVVSVIVVMNNKI
jgi:hypothetical protein